MTRLLLAAWVLFLGCFVARALGEETAAFKELRVAYGASVRPLLARYCHDCHDAANKEGELDLARFASLDDLRADPAPWQLALRMVESGEMPPEEADQPTADERAALLAWIAKYLDAEARARAGDPGPVTLRRLNNAEYAYTIRELTGVAELDPAREFPADGAAGEGFSNAGQALAMSPALAQKYFDAGKEISRHAVLLPDGIRFSPSVSRRDWTDETLTKIRDFYRERSVPLQSAEVRLQGLVWESADGGKIPLARYLEATIVEREALDSGAKSISEVAAERDLNERYLATLWQALNDRSPSAPLCPIRSRWRIAGPTDVPALVEPIEAWQQALWKFNRVGHLGRVGGPSFWMEPQSPLATKTEIRLPLPATEEEFVTLYLSAISSSESAGGRAIWRRPRLVAKNGSELALRDLRTSLNRFQRFRSRLFASAESSFAAIDEALLAEETQRDLAESAKTHGVSEADLVAWMEALEIRRGEAPIEGLLESDLPIGDYDFVRGWGRPETPNAVVNFSDPEVRIPGTLPGRSVAVHPSPDLDAGVAWRSPIEATLKIAVVVRDSHDACGNGLAWRLELRRSSQRLTLASDRVASGQDSSKEVAAIAVRPSDVVALVVGAADKDHVCDLTGVDLTLTDAATGKAWNLATDVTTKETAKNPAPDRFGGERVWHFFAEPANGSAEEASAANEALVAWLLESDADRRRIARESLARLFAEGPNETSTDDQRELYRRFASAAGPLFELSRRNKDDAELTSPADRAGEGKADPEATPLSPFDVAIDGVEVAGEDLVVDAPSVLTIQLPQYFAGVYDFVVEGLPGDAPLNGADVSGLQLAVTIGPQPNPKELRSDLPILIGDDPVARKAIEDELGRFRDLFPAALCYTRIVPIDEVVTLRLIHREDEPLRRLFLSPEETAWLDRAWEELRFVGQDALRQVDAYEQLMEYATQDADPSVFAPLREPIQEAAKAFERRLVETEPVHVAAAIDFAERAWRRPLAPSERDRLASLYQDLRASEMPHEEAIRAVIARILVSPAFLYRLEQAPPGESAQPVNDHELAVRLSYFLWASPPDEELRAAADAGRLSDPETLLRQTRRMLRDGRVERLAREFGCQWLHVRDFATSDEKSAVAFPEFADLRDDLAEEPAKFFADFFQNDRPVASLFDSDAVFVNEALAAHYGIPWQPSDPKAVGADADDWRRIEGAGSYGRGGILAMGAVLSKQSGASRTSAVLRGTWISESLLGERLPRPPKDVPPLPEQTPAGLTERELVARHAADAACAKCHVRIDPFGFALESYDAIGRRRDAYGEGQPIDASAKLVDGTQFVGVEGLRAYLLGPKREETTRQFCRKLLGYALGRSVRLSDEPLLDEMLANLDANDGRISAAVETIVRSEQFRKIRGADWVEATSLPEE